MMSNLSSVDRSLEDNGFSLKEFIMEKIDEIENSKAPIGYFFLTFFFVIAIRNLLEASLYPQFYDISKVFNINTLIHFYLCYLFLALGIVLIFYLGTKTPILKIVKIVFPFFIILTVAPVVDFIIRWKTGNPGVQMGYIVRGTMRDMIYRYFTFFGNFEPRSVGITTGMKIEILLIILLGFIYVYLSSSNILKSIGCAGLLYTFIFWVGAYPIVLEFIFYDLMGTDILGRSMVVQNYIYLILILLFGTAILYIHDKKLVVNIIKDMRPERIAHFQLMFIMGIGLAVSSSGKIPSSFEYLRILMALITIVLACLYSLFINNIEDVEIDKISNVNRPLIKGDISLETYKKMSWGILFTTFLFAYLVDEVFLFFIITFLATYFVYSAPPLRLKRLFILSKALISFNSLVLVISGYWFIYNSTENFPNTVILMIMVGFTMVINFIDLKDHEGDKESGIITLPVMIGLKRAKVVIGISFIVTYSMAIFIFGTDKIYMLIPLFLIGLTEYFLVNKKDYKEIHVFMIYLSSLFLLMVLYMAL